MCPDYEGIPYDKAKSGEICKHYHLVDKSCKIYDCECVFSLKREGYEGIFDLCKTFKLVKVR